MSITFSSIIMYADDHSVRHFMQIVIRVQHSHEFINNYKYRISFNFGQ